MKIFSECVGNWAPRAGKMQRVPAVHERIAFLWMRVRRHTSAKIGLCSCVKSSLNAHQDETLNKNRYPSDLRKLGSTANQQECAGLCWFDCNFETNYTPSKFLRLLPMAGRRTKGKLQSVTNQVTDHFHAPNFNDSILCTD